MFTNALYLTDCKDCYLLNAMGSYLKGLLPFKSFEHLPISNDGDYKFDTSPKTYILTNHVRQQKDDFIKLIEDIKIANPDNKIIVFCLDVIEFKYLKDIISKGVNGVISKYASEAEVININEKIYEHKFQLCSTFQELVLNNSFNNVEYEQNFTEKEMMILNEAIKGSDIKQTAENLNLSPNTVAVYRAKMLKKTGMNSMQQLIANVRKSY